MSSRSYGCWEQGRLRPSMRRRMKARCMFTIFIPIDYAFHQRFTSVIDSGTLEHVLNYPVALKHCMELGSLGGHFLAITPANHFFGHGFYQFSPDLFYRVFTLENGFGIQQMWLLKRTASSGSRFPTRQTCAIGSLS